MSTVPLPRGFHAHVANIGIKDDTDDFVVVASDTPCAAAAVFTRSRFAGPSVEVSRRHAADRSRALNEALNRGTMPALRRCLATGAARRRC